MPAREKSVMRSCLLCIVPACCVFCWGLVAAAALPETPRPLLLHMQSRVEKSPGSGQFEVVAKTVRWEPRKTAVIICDMWARHWCDGACKRGAQMAPRMNQFVLVGVHTNMCVIGRPFGLRNMVRAGKNVALVRDLTDTMYNPRQPPKVPHVVGTDLIVEYIEKYVCPTITSGQLLAGPALRFAEDQRPHVVFVVWEDEYDGARSLTDFAGRLRDGCGCRCTVLVGEEGQGIAGLEELGAADLMVLFARRKMLPGDQLDRIRKYLGAGKPLVALRTASHAFSVRGKTPQGLAQWPEFDAEVLGGNYHGHAGNKLGTDVAEVPAAAGHAILAGVEPKQWRSASSLYLAAPIDPRATVLMRGSIEGKTEPVAWTRSYQGGRVFYTLLGDPEDFKLPQFQQLAINAVFWAMDRPVPKAHP